MIGWLRRLRARKVPVTSVAALDAIKLAVFERVRYEYRLEDIGDLGRGKRVHEERLEAWAADGWRVVYCWPDQRGDTRITRMLLERPRFVRKRWSER